MISYTCSRQQLCAITSADTEHMQTCMHSDWSTRQTYTHDANTPNVRMFFSMFSMLQCHCACADGIYWCMQLTEGGVLFFRESCFKPSGDKKRGNNPTHYRYSGSEDSLKLWMYPTSILYCLHALVAVAPAMIVDITDPAAVRECYSNAWLAAG